MNIGIDVSILKEEKRGMGYYLTNLLEKFSQLANENTFYLYSPRPIQYQVLNKNWYYRFGRTLLPGSFWLQTKCKSLCKKDRIETFFGPSHILPLNLPKTIKKVLAVHDLTSILYPHTMRNYTRFIHKLFFAQSIRVANHIITLSEATEQSIIHNFGIDKAKITVIYEGVSGRYKPMDESEVLPIISRHNIKKPYILSVGTLEPRKNYPVLLKAFQRLRSECMLVIVGKRGWKTRKIFTLIKALKLQNRVKILGYVRDEELPFLYNGAEIFVFPSLYEGFGLPVLEALACGTPVVCSNSSSLPEIGGDAVLYFNPRSVDELISRLEYLLNHDDLRNTLREKGIERAKQFTWDRTAQKTLAVLKGL